MRKVNQPTQISPQKKRKITQLVYCTVIKIRLDQKRTKILKKKEVNVSLAWKGAASNTTL